MQKHNTLFHIYYWHLCEFVGSAVGGIAGSGMHHESIHDSGSIQVGSKLARGAWQTIIGQNQLIIVANFKGQIRIQPTATISTVAESEEPPRGWKKIPPGADCYRLLFFSLAYVTEWNSILTTALYYLNSKLDAGHFVGWLVGHLPIVAFHLITHIIGRELITVLPLFLIVVIMGWFILF